MENESYMKPVIFGEELELLFPFLNCYINYLEACNVYKNYPFEAWLAFRACSKGRMPHEHFLFLRKKREVVCRFKNIKNLFFFFWHRAVLTRFNLVTLLNSVKVFKTTKLLLFYIFIKYSFLTCLSIR